jgi:hypothetical protein
VLVGYTVEQTPEAVPLEFAQLITWLKLREDDLERTDFFYKCGDRQDGIFAYQKSQIR